MTVPDKPSPEALAQLRKTERGGQRKSLEGLRPHGLRFALTKALVRAIDAAIRPPRTTTVRRLDTPPGWWIAADGADEANGVVLPPVHRGRPPRCPRCPR